jgi:G3E family GTPase
MKAFGEFFNNQIAYATTIVLSRSQNATPQQLELCVKQMQALNEKAAIITTPWDQISGEAMLKVIEGQDSLEVKLLAEEHAKRDQEEHEHEHHHDHDHDHEEHEHHHDHDHEEHEHHHDHDHEEHEHHHDHDHEHHHHHHADDIFASWGKETPRKYSRDEIESILKTLSDDEFYGTILRAKGMVENTEGGWIYFDMVPGEYELRDGEPDYTGRLCVIGCDLKDQELSQLFLLD